jgi:lipopolysaccharide/colanic/teichoic acid biosynthesis glycosyltransferase
VVKRVCEILFSALALALAAPMLCVAMGLIWAQDGGSPLYFATRVGRLGRDFRMVKLRSMTPDADRCGRVSTSRSDTRITPIGKVLRRSKLDEVPQFWNVLIGEMSLVGPRPNVRQGGVDRYTAEEMRLLSVRPGITDLASIVFSDEADILDGATDPHARYDANIRPWKSRLGLMYVTRHGIVADLRIVWLTAMAIVAKPAALRGVDALLVEWGADDALRRVCRRDAPPPAGAPPDRPT